MEAYYTRTYDGGFIKYANFDVYGEAYIYRNKGRVEMPATNFIRLAIF